MDITYAEYMNLKNEVEKLREQVSRIEKEPKRTFAECMSETPIGYITSVNRCGEMFEYNSINSDAWLHFVKLAKALHVADWKFAADRTGHSRGFMRSYGNHRAPRRIDDLTPEQFNASVDMLNEMIPIYNKYFKQMHQGVYVNNLHDKDGEFRFVKVQDF